MTRSSRVLTGVAAAALLSGCAAQNAASSASTARVPEASQTPTVVAAHVDPSASEASSSKVGQSETAADDAARSQAQTWTGCMISKADLEAETKERATLAPAGGQILFLNWADPRPGHSQRLTLIVGLGNLPTSTQQVPFKGRATLHQEGEFGTLESDIVDGKISTGTQGSGFEVTVTARDNLKKRLESDGAGRFSVEVRRVKRTDECRSATTG
ncbi:MAG: hypothetical protein HY898_17750 [Deltaproteobacteria bacterium]|nr:hypothetical protein [Deltaproteobacteria bacterium]